MSKDIQEIAHTLAVTEPEAQQFCVKVQGCLRPRLPLHIVASLIVDYLQQNPHAETVPEKIASHICHKYPRMQRNPSKKVNVLNSSQQSRPTKKTHSRKKKSSSPSKDPNPGRSTDTNLISAVADLIPDEDRGNRQKAQQFLIDLERRYPKSRKLSNRQLLSAIKHARRKDSLQMDQVVLEIRKRIYGYRGNPDEVRVIFIPMGGKNSR